MENSQTTDLGSKASVSQLSDNQPKFDCPLRLAIPVNVPPRKEKLTTDALIHNAAFSPAAFAANKKALTAKIISGGDDISSSSSLPSSAPGRTAESYINMDHDATMKTQISDLTTLCMSSKRAGKKDLEAAGYASLGVIYDNQDKYTQAIEHYKQYFLICEQMGDATGCACACNCLGVDYMLMVCPPSDAGTLMGANIDAPNAASHLQKAIDYHSQHLEIGPDDGGRYVANINLGLCLGLAGNLTQAAKHFQDALRIAIKMQTLYGQSIAVGNLGMLALIKGDMATAQTCFEQHLQLVQALQDPEAEVKAWKMLAQINHQQGKYTKALDNLENAKKIAVKEKFANELRTIHFLIGISKGSLEWQTSIM